MRWQIFIFNDNGDKNLNRLNQKKSSKIRLHNWTKWRS